jgi:hypothetical protein
VRQFLDRCLVFDSEPYDQAAAASFWQALGVDAGWVDIVSVINPFWKEGSLHVNAELQDDPEAFEKVYNLVLYMLKWQQFSESRWATVGTSCRNLVRSLCIGLEEIVSLARANPQVSDFYLHGFARCKPTVKRYACVAAVASYSLEGFLIDVLSDDRVAKRLPEIENNMVEELQYIEGLGDDFWRRLAPIVTQFSAADLKSSAIHCGNTAIAFVKRKVIAVAAGLPWSLARGDISANLDALCVSKEDIRDPTARKIQALLRVGYNRVALADAVALLNEVPWSTLGVESKAMALSLVCTSFTKTAAPEPWFAEPCSTSPGIFSCLLLKQRRLPKPYKRSRNWNSLPKEAFLVGTSSSRSSCLR